VHIPIPIPIYKVCTDTRLAGLHVPCQNGCSVACLLLPLLLLLLCCCGVTSLAPGENMTCTLALLNTGTVGLKDIQTNHPECIGLFDLAPAATTSCNVSKTATQADFDGSDPAVATSGNHVALQLAVVVSATSTATAAPTTVTEEVSALAQLSARPRLTVVSVNFTAEDASTGIRAGRPIQATPWPGHV